VLLWEGMGGKGEGMGRKGFAGRDG